MASSDIQETAPRASTHGKSEITVRTLEDRADCEAAVEMQRYTWGEHFSELVPPSMMLIVKKMGGFAAGGFTSDGKMVAVLFGLTGLYDGRPAHWSHMLGVREEYRDQGIGGRLKMLQRDHLRELGVDAMYWSFDPLVARNANLNLIKLGVEITEYAVNFYGDSDSVLHRIQTDRFIVKWDLVGKPDGGASARSPDPVVEAPLVNATSQGIPIDPDTTTLPDAPSVRVEVPPDVDRLLEESIEDALPWRFSTRTCFLWYLDRGYRVSGFHRDDENRYYYTLTIDGG